MDYVASLLAAAVGLTNTNAPDTVPKVQFIAGPELQTMACGSPSKCKDLHFFTEPTTGTIYVDKKVDMYFTFSQAELIHELARYVLAQNKVYSVNNSCKRNVEIEDALTRLEMDFIKGTLTDGKYVGYGIPTRKDLPKHVFFCIPDVETKGALK